MTTFCIVQECLTNIHRHSGSSTARIAIHKTPSVLIVEVSDQGTACGAEYPKASRFKRAFWRGDYGNA